MSTTTPQKFEFQAEIKQLLDIVIHSLYTEKEIFVRELVSNASDALEKLRHLRLTEKEIFDDTLELEINVTTDDKAKTITLQDFGVGMSRDELVKNLGTIAHSGSKAFLKALGEGGPKNANLIGQFGVGFYSAFMVAKSVKVYSHSWKKDEEYTEFYKFQAHAFEEPRLRLHFSADAPLSINALLFVPKENTEKLGLSRLEPSVSLYCRKVMIDAKPKDLLPEWLRFLKGVVDSEDLPLNISRETMQDKSLIEKLNKVITKRFLKFLE